MDYSTIILIAAVIFMLLMHFRGAGSGCCGAGRARKGKEPDKEGRKNNEGGCH